VETDHVSAKLDARRVFADLNKLVDRSANAVGGAAPGVPEPLTDAQLDELAGIVKSPTFDVYVSKTDGTIRRVSGNIRVVVPEKDRARLNGIAGGSLRFTVELQKVNGGQSIEVPAKVRPIADLSEQLGGARALTPQTEPQPEMPTPGTPAAPGSSGNTPDLGTFEQYSQCLDRARPDDTRALSRCAELLR
jgi:bifunctional DNA-binding transcriptional regulator/antitoxin component of YhaV-PrlF toxin-antitoxin module